MNTDHILPIRCGLKFKPPMLAIFYKDLNTGKLRRRNIPLRGFDQETNVSVRSMGDSLLRRPSNSDLVSMIPRSQLDSLLQRVVDCNSKPEESPDQTPVPSPSPSPLLGIPPLSTPLSTPTKQEAQQLNEDFDAALAELLGDDSEGALDTTVQDPGSSSKPSKGEATISVGEQLKQPSSSITVKSHEPKSKSHDEPTSDDPKAKTHDHDSSTSSSLSTLPPLLIKPTESNPSFDLESVLRQAGAFDNTTEAPDDGEPDYSADFNSESERTASPVAVNKQLEDKSLSFAMEELDEEDGSLALSTGGDLLEGSLSGEDFRSLNIVTPTPDNEGTSRPTLDTQLEDLNKADDGFLAAKKQEMDTKFREHQLKPGDEGYEYDKEANFDEPKIECEWDSDGSYSDF